MVSILANLHNLIGCEKKKPYLRINQLCARRKRKEKKKQDTDTKREAIQHNLKYGFFILSLLFVFATIARAPLRGGIKNILNDSRTWFI